MPKVKIDPKLSDTLDGTKSLFDYVKGWLKK